MKNIKLKKGDNVRILNGKDRGKSGEILAVFKDSMRATVKGIHMQKKHVKPTQANPTGGIIEINKKIDISNMAIICPSCGKYSRIGYKVDKDSKIRICMKCQKSLETGAK